LLLRSEIRQEHDKEQRRDEKAHVDGSVSDSLCLRF
jgi:hypothetical protein